MPQPIIDVQNLSCRFGSKLALDNVSLSINAGGVFGLVGENGAGKTTLIRHLTGLLEAETGTVRIFGADPVADPVGVLGRIGYLSEHRNLPDWMRLGELLRYTQAFYPSWDPVYAEQLMRQFNLDPAAVCKNLSQGQRAKAGLLLAQAHRPDLLLLDEPSSGLDPVVRRDILEAIIRIAAEEGRSVFFSSHLLDEIERVSNRIAIMKQGRILLTGTLDEIKRGHLKIRATFPEPLPSPPVCEGILVAQGSAREWTLLCQAHRTEVPVKLKNLGAQSVESSPASLDDIFVALVGQSAGAATAPT